ncbi:MAG TPA: cupin domain-containing protein [Acetobacteraceae bacterium]|nr:cupin domain-containing protein [Acetobacteraceae bacterium]
MADTITAPPASEKSPGNRETALRAMYEELHQKHLFPFWATSTDVAHDEIKQLLGGKRAVPYLWSYDGELDSLLRRSAELVTMNDSERRSLILVNPGLTPRRATVTTMYTAYRLNDPNEVMPPHKHTASAVRFGLTGAQNFTGVEGEDIVFGPGDLVLTPRDTWHNHGNLGSEPAVNLSVLDLPLVEQLNALDFSHDYSEGEERKRQQTARFPGDYSARIYGAGGLMPRFVDHRRGVGGSSPMYVYRYEPMRELLEKHRDWDGNAHEGLLVEYVDPLSGGPVFKTITFFMQMLRPGETTQPLRQTASLLVAPFEGHGHSIVDGKRFDWNRFDTLAVPGGSWAEHTNDSATEPAILFVASDEPALKAFGLLARWGRDAAGDPVRLA